MISGFHLKFPVEKGLDYSALPESSDFYIIKLPEDNREILRAENSKNNTVCYNLKGDGC